MDDRQKNAKLAAHLSNILGVPVDRVEPTQRAVVAHLPLGSVPPSSTFDLFPEATHLTPIVRDQSLGQMKQNVIDIPWRAVQRVEQLPRPATSALFVATSAALVYLFYQFWQIL